MAGAGSIAGSIMALARLAETNCCAEAVMVMAREASRMAALRLDFENGFPRNDLPQALMYIKVANSLPLRLTLAFV